MTYANIEEALHAGILSLNQREPKEREYFRISSIGQCPCKQVGERAGLVPTNPPNQRSVFKMWAGAVLHVSAQQALTAVGYLYPTKTEVEVTYGGYIGHPDGVAGDAVIEIKTTDDDAITRYPEIPPHYVFQGLTYCLALNLSKVIILQIGRSQGLTRNRLFWVTDEFRHTLDIHIKKMHLAWTTWKESGVLPLHEHRYSWEDRLCPFLEKKETPHGA